MINNSFIILDGGMGQELVKRAKHKLTPLWSADVLRDHPDLVAEVHRDFIQAGADVITLSSYAATPTRLAKYNRQDEFEALQKAAINAAKQAYESAEQNWKKRSTCKCSQNCWQFNKIHGRC